MKKVNINLLEKNYINSLIFFITSVVNIIVINNFLKFDKSIGMGIYAAVSFIYAISYIKKCDTLEKTIRILSMGILIASLAAYSTFYISKIFSLISNFDFQNLLSRYGNKALVVYFIISFLQPIVLPVPEPVTVMAGSAAFGAFKGAIFGCFGTILGIVTMYFFIRATGAKFIDKFVSSKQLDKFNNYIKKNEFMVVLSLFILPILPDEAICIGAGLTKISLYKFVSVAVIAKMITSFSLAYSVDFIKGNSLKIAVIGVCILGIKKLIDVRKLKMKHSI